jgi:hypothetical protein
MGSGIIVDLRQNSGFLWVQRSPSPIILTATIWLTYCWKWRYTPITRLNTQTARYWHYLPIKTTWGIFCNNTDINITVGTERETKEKRNNNLWDTKMLALFIAVLILFQFLFHGDFMFYAQLFRLFFILPDVNRVWHLIIRGKCT